MFGSLGIQRKLWLLGGCLTLILFAAGGLSIALLNWTNEAIGVTFKNNGDAVAYMHDLTDSLAQTDLLLKTALASGTNPPPAALNTLKKSIGRCVSGEFECVSENGEGEAARALEESWQRYQRQLAKFNVGHLDQARSYYSRVLEPEQKNLREVAWSIAGMNLRNGQFRDHGRRLLEAEERWMAVLLALGACLSAGLVIAFGRSLLRPLFELTRGVRAIEQGQLDLQVPVRSSDEMGVLARAFNDMAGRLQRFDRGFRARLLRAQRTTQLAINSFSDPVAVLGSSGRVELCNRSAESVFGLKAGMDLADSSLASLSPLVPPVMAGGTHEPQSYAEALKVSVGGKDKYILPRLMPVQDDRGQVVGVTLVLADVTALRKMDEMKTGLLATISHELKNPLTSVRMGAHLMLEDDSGPLSPRQLKILESLRDNSERLYQILEELLDLGRGEPGGLLHLEVMPADQLVRETLEEAQQEFARRGIRVGLDVMGGLPRVAVDKRRIRHVFSNLYDNAAKYSALGGEVWVGARREGNSVCFWVQDSGSGVDPRYRNKIFERYFRVPGQEAVKGQGLGLAIAKEVAELHGGILKIEDTAKGARFALFLPVDRGH